MVKAFSSGVGKMVLGAAGVPFSLEWRPPTRGGPGEMLVNTTDRTDRPLPTGKSPSQLVKPLAGPVVRRVFRGWTAVRVSAAEQSLIIGERQQDHMDTAGRADGRQLEETDNSLPPLPDPHTQQQHPSAPASSAKDHPHPQQHDTADGRDSAAEGPTAPSTADIAQADVDAMHIDGDKGTDHTEERDCNTAVERVGGRVGVGHGGERVVAEEGETVVGDGERGLPETGVSPADGPTAPSIAEPPAPAAGETDTHIDKDAEADDDTPADGADGAVVVGGGDERCGVTEEVGVVGVGQHGGQAEAEETTIAACDGDEGEGHAAVNDMAPEALHDGGEVASKALSPPSPLPHTDQHHDKQLMSGDAAPSIAPPPSPPVASPVEMADADIDGMEGDQPDNDATAAALNSCGLAGPGCEDRNMQHGLSPIAPGKRPRDQARKKQTAQRQRETPETEEGLLISAKAALESHAAHSKTDIHLDMDSIHYDVVDDVTVRVTVPVEPDDGKPFSVTETVTRGGASGRVATRSTGWDFRELWSKLEQALGVHDDVPQPPPSKKRRQQSSPTESRHDSGAAAGGGVQYEEAVDMDVMEEARKAEAAEAAEAATRIN
ncbi:unnamed protein product [Vitrella brassicaformis CCMP3155]|uniref:Uncharacterized protein n=1 Tax=Vitrella brassicaformis (strain CCMP3155) TaxID=1169540 RepID=A0A0G4FFD2_VITBC|nr:unnamed protein product [Vitrella brassicaformis CCMP3155]|eukprot:CEM11889.1 unnamed protein product [Vitrella brassicaformis CCMP3155]